MQHASVPLPESLICKCSNAGDHCVKRGEGSCIQAVHKRSVQAYLHIGRVEGVGAASAGEGAINAGVGAGGQGCSGRVHTYLMVKDCSVKEKLYVGLANNTLPS